MTVKTAKYKVIGMSCAACAANVEKCLASERGVRAVNLNFAAETVLIEYDQELTSYTILKEKLQKKGYDIELTYQAQNMADEDIKRLKTNVVLSLFFTLPVFILSMFFHHQQSDLAYLMLFLSLPVLWFGRQFFINAWKQVKNLTFSMDTLIATGTGSAMLLSIINTLFPAWMSNMGIEAHLYYEAATVVISMVLLGRYLEKKTRGKTSEAISRLAGQGAKKALLIDTAGEREIAVDEIQKGNILLVKPGDKIPVDGEILEGESFVDESMFTGEAIEVFKQKGDLVIGASINKSGSFKMVAHHVGADTLLSRIISLVDHAQQHKAPVQLLADRIAAVFIPVVIGIALLSSLVWFVFGPQPAFNYVFLSFISVLIIACPCALGLATPTALMAGIGNAAGKGILIRSPENLELLQKADTIVMDKTGTLTEGKPSVTEVIWINKSISQPFARSLITSAEKLSEHPFASALKTWASENETAQLDIENFTNNPGEGISFSYSGITYLIGSSNILKKHGLNTERLTSESSGSKVYLADMNGIIAIFNLTDPLKPASGDAVRKLKKLGFELHILSGDHKTAVAPIAKELGIEKYQSELLPAEKLAYIENLKASGKTVVMVGDGINDSPALAAADIGIAMGTGTDIAMETASIILVKGDLSKISTSIQLSKAMVATIRQNLFWAFIYNIIGIPLAAGLLYPFNGFLLNPMIAGVAMAFSSVSVVSNSLRLRKRQF